MDEAAVREVMAEARDCAWVMLESATYVRRELANVRMSEALRARTEQVCANLVGTKHDVLSQLAELDELLGPEVPAWAARSRVRRIVRWLREDVAQMDRLVKALDSAGTQDPGSAAGYVLVAESAVNVREAFHRTRAAAEALRATEADDSRDA